MMSDCVLSCVQYKRNTKQTSTFTSTEASHHILHDSSHGWISNRSPFLLCLRLHYSRLNNIGIVLARVPRMRQQIQSHPQSHDRRSNDANSKDELALLLSLCITVQGYRNMSKWCCCNWAEIHPLSLTELGGVGGG